MIKNLEKERKSALFGPGLFQSLRDGALKEGNLIDVVSGTLQLIVTPFQKISRDIVTAVTSRGSCNDPMQVIEYHLDHNAISGRECVPGSEEDRHYNDLYWRSLS